MITRLLPLAAFCAIVAFVPGAADVIRIAWSLLTTVLIFVANTITLIVNQFN